MSIKVLQGPMNKLNQSDVNVVIDVIRAFTVAHYAFIKGAKDIILVKTVKEALNLKWENKKFLLAGEVNGLAIEGFDIDNSPCSLEQLKLTGKTLVQKTTNGVTAALNALDAKSIYVTGYSNAKTTANYIKKIYSRNFIAHIIASHPTGDDDLACAEYMRGIIEDTGLLTPSETEERIKASSIAEKFYKEEMSEFNIKDLEYCVKEVDERFVMEVKIINGLPTIVRVNI